MTTKIECRSYMTVKLVDSMGTDLDICRNAWVSTKGERAEEEQDAARVKGLINYLVREKHGSPFESVAFKFLITAPLFVWREFHRHRIGFSYNEESGRYTQLKPVFYFLDSTRPLVQIGKTGHYEYVSGSHEQFVLTNQAIIENSKDSYERYEQMLEAGVAKEVARMVLPVNIFSSCYVTCNARSLMSFLALRTKHPDAAYPSYPQQEISMVADLMEKKFRSVLPITYEAWMKAGRVAP